jgi:hypothetical protein
LLFVERGAGGDGLSSKRWRVVSAGLLAAILLTTGGLLWRSHRESVAKSDLAAEIRAERAARGRLADPVPTAEEAETARLYREATLKLHLDFSETDYFNALDEAPWTAVPKAVTDFLTLNAEAVAILDRAAARGSCRFDRATLPGWSARWQTRRLLLARGHVALAHGAPIAAAEDVLRLLRVGRDFGAGPRPGDSAADGPWPGLQLVGAEEDAAGLLSAVATAPGLPREAGPALVAAARAPWGSAEAFRRGVDDNEDASDAFLLLMLSPGAQEWLDGVNSKMAGIEDLLSERPRDGDLFDRIRDRVRGIFRLGAEVPTAEEVRVYRDLRAPVVAAVRQRDMTALAPGGPHDRIGPVFGFLGPRWFRHCLADEARIAVARTAAAIRAFQLREGHPPRAIEELVPSVLSEVPLDPFDGKPLLYEVDGDGWRVASRVWRDTWGHRDGTTEEYPPAEARFPRGPK